MAIRRLTPEEWQRIYDIYMGEAPFSSLTTAEELHQFAWNYNWDDGLGAPRWIIRNPLCDAGTALLVYWHNAPAWVYQFASRDEVPDWARSGFDLAKEIEQRYLSGFYTGHKFHFDPLNDEENDWREEIKAYTLQQEIPPQMFQATPGEVSCKEEF